MMVKAHLEWYRNALNDKTLHMLFEIIFLEPCFLLA